MTIELDGITAGTLEVARVARAISRTKARLKAHLKRKAERPGHMNATIATETRRPGSLQRIVGHPSNYQ